MLSLMSPSVPRLINGSIHGLSCSIAARHEEYYVRCEACLCSSYCFIYEFFGNSKKAAYALGNSLKFEKCTI